jgi:heptosyltransferase-2
LLQLPEADVATALHALRLQPGQFSVFAPGAEFGPAKRWPAAHFAAVARELDVPGAAVGFWQGGSAVRRDRQRCAGALHQPGRQDQLLQQALAAISAAKHVVSNDSGLMHVAAAFGVPQVAVFGSSSPLHTPPLNDRAHVLWLKNDADYQPALDCAPCFQRECPLGHTRCLNDVTPAQVLQFL